MRTPVAYLRRSSAIGSKCDACGEISADPRARDCGHCGSALKQSRHGHISYAVQERAVLELAAKDGDAEPEMIVEWGRSGAARSGTFGGTGRGGKRRAWLVLRERIAAGEVSVVYAYSLSRLARSTRELLDVAEACAAAGTKVRLAKEGTLDFATPSGRLYLTVLAAVSAFEAEVSRERAMDRVNQARDDGRYLGEPPTGWVIGEDGKLCQSEDRTVVEAVLSAFKQTGNYRQAARLLNEQGIPSARGGKWVGGVVRTFVSRELGTRHAPTRRGSRTHPTEPLARLLYCSACGGGLTPERKKYKTNTGTSEYRGWRCFRAHSDSGHPQPTSITETRLLPALKAEAGHLEMPADRVRAEAVNAAAVAALDERRSRLVDALEAGTLTRPEVETRLAAIEAERERLTASTAAWDIIPQAIDWSWPPETLGPVLSALWLRVDVDLAAGTIEAEWAQPALRAA